MSIMNNAGRDMVANLLAEENLTVVRKRADTAYFDVEKRILALPIWDFMSLELEDMLVSHEVGHAVFTDSIELMEKAFAHENANVFRSYFNIVEDIRIERMMKRRFPGIRKCFYKGYAKAMEADMFRLEHNKDDIAALDLIDRLNLYFKVGSFIKVPFVADELALVERAKNTETMEDAYHLALDLFDLAAHLVVKNDAPTNRPKQSTDDDAAYEDCELRAGPNSVKADGEDDGEEGEESGTAEGDATAPSKDDSANGSSEDNADSKSNASGEKSGEPNEVAAPVTSDRFQDAVDDMISKGYNDNKYYEICNNVSNNIVGYKEFMVACVDRVDAWGNCGHAAYNKFMDASKNNVAYMVKEFEMRKAASNYARNQVAKSGSLNMNKIYAYKINDDLFKRITHVANGKNHGMIMLVDWSGSMASVIEDVLKQTINLVMFCRRIGIPFEVFAFASYGALNAKVRPWPSSDTPALNNNLHTLLNLFSSKMSQAEFTSMCKVLLIKRPWDNVYTLHSTPLNDALVTMIDYVPAYIRANGIEKMSMVVLTDGESSSLKPNVRGYGNSYEQWVIRDTITKKNYPVSAVAEQTGVLLEMLRDRHGVKVIGFDLFEGNAGGAAKVYRRNFGGGYSVPDMMDAMNSIKKEGVAMFKGLGRDVLFAIAVRKMKMVDKDIGDIDKGDTIASIAKNFSSSVASAKTSRVLLRKFVEHMA